MKSLINLKIFGATFEIGGESIAPIVALWLRAWQGRYVRGSVRFSRSSIYGH